MIETSTFSLIKYPLMTVLYFDLRSVVLFLFLSIFYWGDTAVLGDESDLLRSPTQSVWNISPHVKLYDIAAM